MLIGLDAFDVVIARQLAAEGRLPTLGGLFADWWSAPTITPPGLVVGGVWPSIATGTWPTRHGFYCDRQLVPGTYTATHRGPHDLAVAPVWSALSRAGVRCAVVDFPITVVAPDLHGAQLVEWGTHDRFLPLSGTPELVTDVLARFGEYPVQPKCDDYVDDLGQLRTDLLAAVRVKRDLVADLLTAGAWDVFVAVLCESHCAGHHFWAGHDPGHPWHDARLRTELGDPLLDVYTAMDAALADVLGAVPPDADVFVLLSHGIGPHYDGDHLLSAILRALDGHTVRDRFVHGRERVIRSTTRVRRHDDHLPLDGGRRWFKVPNNELYGGIRLNVQGREPRGRVSPRDVEAVGDELIAALRELENADTGSPVVQGVLRTSDLYPDMPVDALPDLLVDWNRDEPIFAARSPRVGVVRHGVMARRSGDHRPHGLLLGRSAGAPVRPSLLARPVPVVDIAPTVAARVGVELPCDGTPLPQWL